MYLQILVNDLLKIIDITTDLNNRISARILIYRAVLSDNDGKLMLKTS